MAGETDYWKGKPREWYYKQELNEYFGSGPSHCLRHATHNGYCTQHWQALQWEQYKQRTGVNIYCPCCGETCAINIHTIIAGTPWPCSKCGTLFHFTLGVWREDGDGDKTWHDDDDGPEM